MNISKFNSTKFYREFTTKPSSWKGASGIWDIEFMRDSGSIELLASYYKAKYDITAILKPMEDIDVRAADVAEYIKDARERAKGHEEYREVLFVKYKGDESFANGHIIPIIYIKDKGKEVLFLANSLGLIINNHEWIFKKPGIPVYAIHDMREKSYTGCVIDAFVFLKDAIGKKDGSYRIPDLLAHLQDHSSIAEEDKRYNKVTALHPRLLKTFQSSSLVAKYSDPADKDIAVNKKEKTIAQHFEFYEKPAQGGKEMPSYIAQKGMKLRGVVEMEFYLQQMLDITIEQRKKFIEGAKKILNPKAPPSNDPTSQLYEYACDFAQDNSFKIKLSAYPTPEAVPPSPEAVPPSPEAAPPLRAPASRLQGGEARPQPQSSSLTTVLACGLGGALLGALVTTSFAPSATKSAVIINTVVGGFIGLVGGAVYSVGGRG